MRQLLFIFTLLALAACSKSGEPLSVMIGQNSRPAFDDITVGQTYPSLKVSGTTNVGEIVISSGGIERSRFAKGGMVWPHAGGSMEFKGKVDQDCFLYVVKGSPGSPVTILDKKRIPAAELINIVIDLDSLQKK